MQAILESNKQLMYCVLFCSFRWNLQYNYSPKAHECGLQISLLQRLYDHDVYTSEGPMQSCKTLLAENRRSHHNVPISMFSYNVYFLNQTLCHTQHRKK